MGSLPNLHELEEIERRRERRRERELLRRQKARESSREHGERLFAQRKQSSYNAYLMAGLGMGGGGTGIGVAAAATATHSTAATGGSGNPSSTVNTAFAVGGAALLNYGAGATTGLLSTAKYLHHHHRHSLTTSRHRVIRTRSSGTTQNIYDEQLLEHLAAYSPVSTRSYRINPVSSYQVHAALAASRRRESINSSIGATSIRRLITLNSRNCRHKIPPHVRQKVCKNFIFLTISHLLNSAVLIPLIGLQGSNSIWHHREQWLRVGPNIGSLLLSITFLISAGMCLLSTRLIRKFGYTLLLTGNYLAVSIFLLCHLYPSIYTLLPAYILLGITLSPSCVSKIALVVHFGSKLSCSQHDCTFSSAHAADSLDEHKLFCNRDQKIRRLARWYHALQDLGIILGAVVASVLFSCTTSDWNCFNGESDIGGSEDGSLPQPFDYLNQTNVTFDQIAPVTAALYEFPSMSTNTVPYSAASYFDDFYNLNEHGMRICGADMCPLWRQDYNSYANFGNANETIFKLFIHGKAREGSLTLIAVYLLFTVAALILVMLIGKVQATFRHERIKGITDTLLFAGPMAYFIGTEQAYMLGDFLRAFVSCSLGISMVAGALVGMGIMQCIVSCTLSMLLRHTKRIVVILAGFFFHSCLLLALSRWKPSSDDSALFFVLAASWGACNGMWETLLTALITINHTNHVAEVAAPLQGLRFLGLGATFAAHGFMCETPKLIILVIILVVSVLPYSMLEIRMEAQRKAHLVNL